MDLLRRDWLRRACLPLVLLLLACSSVNQFQHIEQASPTFTPAAPTITHAAVAAPVLHPAATLAETQPAPPRIAASIPFTVGGWNVGLDDASQTVIADDLAAFDGVDLWGLAEVNRVDAAPVLAAGAEEGEHAAFGRVLGTSGGGMRLLALYDTSRFDLLGSQEIDAVNTTGNARAPLVLHLRDKVSGEEFLFMVNHLYRSKNAERLKQARLLNAWARTQSLPVIAVGDYNFDWAVRDGAKNHDAAYDALTANNVWRWVQPPSLVTTQCSGWPCAYNSVLDFVFTAGPAQAWHAASTIVVRPGDFPDDAATSDHRPVLAQVWPRQ